MDTTPTAKNRYQDIRQPCCQVLLYYFRYHVSNRVRLIIDSVVPLREYTFSGGDLSMSSNAQHAQDKLIKQVALRFTEGDCRRLEEIGQENEMLVTELVRHYVVSALHPRLP